MMTIHGDYVGKTLIFSPYIAHIFSVPHKETSTQIKACERHQDLSGQLKSVLKVVSEGNETVYTTLAADGTIFHRLPGTATKLFLFRCPW